MKLVYFIIALVFLVLGIFIGVSYQISRQAYKSEEIIAKEIVLLEKYKNYPNCKTILNSNSDWVTNQTNDRVIVWKRHIDQGYLKKMIVDTTMTSAYEERKFDCSK